MEDRWYTASAPGKFVILGEHAVVYGKPALVLAVDRRMTCSVRFGPRNTINGERVDLEKQPHLKYLTRNIDHCVEFLTRSRIPVGSGMGSSAALSAAAAMALRALQSIGYEEKDIVDDAYGAELYAQGSGSPMDASACVHGKGITVNVPDTDRPLWTISRGERTWNVSDIDVPDMTFVIGNTGIKAPTGPQVDKVRRFITKNHFAADIMDEIESTTLEGYDAIRRNNVEHLGRLMTSNHKLLSILGVSCKELNKLVNAALPFSYGAKLTGSGGGGCMVALTDDPQKVCETIKSHGGTPYIVQTGVQGARLENGDNEDPVVDIIP
jgi:mevalonate kinase